MFVLELMSVVNEHCLQMPGPAAGWNPNTSRIMASLSCLQGSSMVMQRKTWVISLFCIALNCLFILHETMVCLCWWVVVCSQGC